MDEERVRKISGFILWTISGLMGMSLYLGFAGASWVSIIVAVALSGSLEAGKILSFRRAGLRFKVLAICLSVLTLVSILGSTLMTIEARKQNSLQTRIEALQSSRQYLDLLGDRNAIKAQADDLQARIAVLPPDWVTMTLKMTDELACLREHQGVLSSKLTQMELTASASSNPTVPTIFGAIARVVGLDEGKVEIIVLLILAALVEITAFSLAGHQDRKVGANPIATETTPSGTQSNPSISKPAPLPPSITRELKVTPEAYLRVALDHPKKPYLLGRGKVSEKLGITETEAKDFIEALVREGKVKRESKFFVAR